MTEDIQSDRNSTDFVCIVVTETDEWILWEELR